MHTEQSHCVKCGVADIFRIDGPHLCTYCATTQYAETLTAEKVRLFQPAPNQLPGQLQLG